MRLQVLEFERPDEFHAARWRDTWKIADKGEGMNPTSELAKELQRMRDICRDAVGIMNRGTHADRHENGLGGLVRLGKDLSDLNLDYASCR